MNIENVTKNFFDALIKAEFNYSILTDDIPTEFILSQDESEDFIQWKLIEGNLTIKDYAKIESKFGVNFPKSFIHWHKRYFFLEASLPFLRLPNSNPNCELKSLIHNLNNDLAHELITQKIYPFGDEGNDTGPLVFDGRVRIENNEFPIRVYDHEYGGNLNGLSEIIFSSFEKLLECCTHYFNQQRNNNADEIIDDFFRIDPEGAGKTGLNYWKSWKEMLE